MNQRETTGTVVAVPGRPVFKSIEAFQFQRSRWFYDQNNPQVIEYYHVPLPVCSSFILFIEN